MREDKYMRFIIFLDALDVLDVGPWLSEHLIDQYNPGVPKVTPNVISQIMTGKRQEDMKFVRSTPYKKPRESHISEDTILHYATRKEKKLRVLQYGIPLCSNIQLPEGSISTYDHFLQGQAVPPILQFAQNNMDFQKDDPELIFHGMVDQTSALFCTMRSLARNGQFDIIFIGYTLIDAYTHWYHEENKKRLIQVVEEELKDLNRYGDILFFSDHGSSAKTDNFFINQFLKKEGYFDYEINFKLRNFHKSYNKKFPDHIGIDHPHVFIDWNKTKFFCNDAFDAMIDKTENATKEDCLELKKKLMETGYFDNVHIKDEVFDPDGKEYDSCPWIMPDSKEGIVTSGNLHPKVTEDPENANSMDLIRPGWHTNRAVVGCTDPSLTTKINGPADIFTLMKEFIDKQEPEVEEKIKKAKDEIEEDEDRAHLIENKLAEMGYV